MAELCPAGVKRKDMGFMQWCLRLERTPALLVLSEMLVTNESYFSTCSDPNMLQIVFNR